MATGGEDPGKDERDFRHCCSLCLEPYKGRTPKILPCFHTFCLPCLTALQANLALTTPQGQGQDGRGQAAEGQDQTDAEKREEGKSDDVTCGGDDAVQESDVFLCPTCRAPVHIPGGGVAALQTNFYLDYEDADDAVPCDMCDVTNRQPATHACHQCKLRMCTACRRYHDMIARDHDVAPVNKPMKREKISNCSVHQGQPLCFHCRQCDVSICLHCKVTSHEGHATVDMAHAALESREEVTSLVARAQEQLQIVESAARRLDRDDRDLTRYTQEVRQQMHARYDALITWAQSARDQVMDDVTAQEEEVRGQLRVEKTAAMTTVELLSNLIARAARGVGMANDQDAVWLRKELQAALLGEDRLARHREIAERTQNPACSWIYDVTEGDVVSGELLAAYMGRVVKEEDGGATAKPLSLREVSDRLDRLTTDVTETTGNITKQLDACTDDVTTLKKKAASLGDDVTTLKKNEAELQKKATSLGDDVTTLKKKAASLGDDVTTLKKNEAELRKKTASLGDDVTTLKKNEAELQKKTTSLGQEVSTIKSTATTLTNKMEKVGKTVAFHAKGKKSITYYGKPIIFQTVLVNEGGGYDAASGVFTVTVPGTYTFTASIGCTEDSVAQAYIHVDGKDYCYIRGSYRATGSGSVSVKLSAGQKVHLKAFASQEYFTSSELSFTGALIQPDL